jgi:hypothetical protein
MGEKLPAITVPGGVLTGHFAHSKSYITSSIVVMPWAKI